MNRKRLHFNFIGRSKIWFIISAVVILAGVAGYFIQGGFNFGIDFLGGSLIEVEFDQDTESAGLREVLADEGYRNSIIQQTGSDKYIIRIKAEEIGKPISIEEKNRILDALDQEIGINRELLQDRTVDPGFGGQPFIEGMTSKIERLSKRIDELSSPAEIEVDGGITSEIAPMVVQAGATVLVAGSAVFNNPLGISKALHQIRQNVS